MKESLIQSPTQCFYLGVKKLDSHLWIEIKNKRRDLVSGFLGKEIISAIQECGADPFLTWNELGKICFSKDSESFGCCADFFLSEYFGGKIEWQEITPSKWLNLAEKDPKKNIQYLCDWIEAFHALITYSLYKERPEMFQDDKYKSKIEIMVHQAKTRSDISEGEKKQAYELKKSILENSFQIPFLDSKSELHTAWNRDLRQDWQHRDLDKWLILIWPLVLHQKWTMADLLKVIEKAFLNPKTSTNIVTNSYPCTNYNELSTHCRNVIGLKGRVKKGRQKKSLHSLPFCYQTAVKIRSELKDKS